MPAAASVLSRGAPGPPPRAASPVSWGNEGYVRSVLEPCGFAVSVTAESLVFSSPSVEARIEREEQVNPYWVATRERLAASEWAAPFRATSPYLLITARR